MTVLQANRQQVGLEDMGFNLDLINLVLEFRTREFGLLVRLPRLAIDY